MRGDVTERFDAKPPHRVTSETREMSATREVDKLV